MLLYQTKPDVTTTRLLCMQAHRQDPPCLRGARENQLLTAFDAYDLGATTDFLSMKIDRNWMMCTL